MEFGPFDLRPAIAVLTVVVTVSRGRPFGPLSGGVRMHSSIRSSSATPAPLLVEDRYAVPDGCDPIADLRTAAPGALGRLAAFSLMVLAFALVLQLSPTVGLLAAAGTWAATIVGFAFAGNLADAHRDFERSYLWSCRAMAGLLLSLPALLVWLPVVALTA